MKIYRFNRVHNSDMDSMNNNSIILSDGGWVHTKDSHC